MVKVKMCFILLLVSLSVVTNSQIYVLSGRLNVKQFEPYVVEHPNVSVSLNLLDDNLYYLDFSVRKDDTVNAIILSYGDVNKVGSFYYLTDITSGFQIVLEKKSDEQFFVKQGFYFLKGQILEERGKVYPVVMEPEQFVKGRDGLKKRMKNYRDDKERGMSYFQPRVYSGECGFNVSFNEDYQYDIFVEPSLGEYFVISTGSWKRKGNNLILNDLDLNFSFVIWLKDRKLYRVRFPSGDCQGDLLYRRSNIVKDSKCN